MGSSQIDTATAVEAEALALLAVLERQRADLRRADSEIVRGYAADIAQRVQRLLAHEHRPSAARMNELRTALSEHARLVAASAARTERGLRSLGLDEVKIAPERSRFGNSAAAPASTRLIA